MTVTRIVTGTVISIDVSSESRMLPALKPAENSAW